MKTPIPSISIVMGCFNEQEYLPEVYERVTRALADQLTEYPYEIIITDNASTDDLIGVLRRICAADKRAKVIINNFGHIRSPYHAIMDAGGDAVIYMASDQERINFEADFAPKQESQSEFSARVDD